MGKSYINGHYKATLPQYNFIRTLTEGCSETTYSLFCHILVSTLYKLSSHADDLYVPVASQLINEKLKRASWRKLASLDLIETTDYSRSLRLSRAFKVKEWIVIRFLELGEGISTIDSQPQPKVNLFTGKPTTRVAKSKLYDENRHPEPKLIHQAIDVISSNGCIYNRPAVEQHLRELEGSRQSVELEKGTNSQEYTSVYARWQNDYLCYESVREQRPRRFSTDLEIYSPAFKVARTGRIHPIGGGFQSCSKQMKAAAFSGIPDVHNYDLKDSQVYGLIQEFELAGLDTSWLVEYGNTPNNKDEFAKYAGISPASWKQCLLALIMGATLPKTTARPEKRKNSILSELYREASGEIEKAEHLLRGFAKGVSGLLPELTHWQDWLLDGYIPKFKKNCRAGSFIVNKCGKRLYLHEMPRARHEAKGVVAAFLLQGQESCFIHHLTLLDASYGYRVMANEHDGLITHGEIPDAAIKEAASLSGLSNAHLVEKEFVSRNLQATGRNSADEPYQRFASFIGGESYLSGLAALAS